MGGAVIMYLSGCISQAATVEATRRADLGFMLQPGMGNRPDLSRTHWAADNGCYSQGANFDVGAWLEWLASMRRFRSTCLFAVAPDVPYDWRATWERSEPYFATIRHLGYTPALAAQNGMPLRLLDLGGYDVLFIGGDDDFKRDEHTFQLARKARRQGRWVHMGRVNTWSRLRAAHTGLIDSVDGTTLAFGPDRNLPIVLRWLDRVNTQTTLEAFR